MRSAARVSDLCLLVEMRLRKLYGERLRGLALYGSYARGEADDGSDVDVVVLLDELDDFWRELRETRGPAAASRYLDAGIESGGEAPRGAFARGVEGDLEKASPVGLADEGDPVCALPAPACQVTLARYLDDLANRDAVARPVLARLVVPLDADDPHAGHTPAPNLTDAPRARRNGRQERPARISGRL